MQFEILNTIYYLVYVILFCIGYYYIKKKYPIKWKWCFLTILLVTGVTHKQFYTLTEKADVVKTSSMMLQQKNNFNTKEVTNYLDKTKTEDNFKQSKSEYELQLLEEQRKSKQLAESIDNNQ